jgi:hypothetical protein
MPGQQLAGESAKSFLNKRAVESAKLNKNEQVSMQKFR